jgi:hypothetical protein
MNCLRLWCCIGFSASAFACSGAADIPSTPDLSTLRARYDSPTAMLDTTKAADLISQAPPMSQLAAAFRTTTIAADRAGHAGDGAASQSSSKIRIQGSIRVNLRCPGELAGPVYDAQTNGSISLTLAVADNHILRYVGGEAAGCVLRGDLADTSVRVGLDGPIDFDLGKDLGFREGWAGELLVRVQGELTINALSFRNLSARFTDSHFESLFTLSDGSYAVLEVAESGIIIRDQRGTWFCVDAQSCTPQ